MLRYLLDTNFCIRVLRDRPPALRDRFNAEADGLSISTIVLTELLHGAAKSARPAIVNIVSTPPFGLFVLAVPLALKKNGKRASRTGPFCVIKDGRVLVALLATPLVWPPLSRVLHTTGTALNPALGGTARFQAAFGLLLALGAWLGRP